MAGKRPYVSPGHADSIQLLKGTRSWVWSFFKRVGDGTSYTSAICQFGKEDENSQICGKVFTLKNGHATRSLSRHLHNEHGLLASETVETAADESKVHLTINPL